MDLFIFQKTKEQNLGQAIKFVLRLFHPFEKAKIMQVTHFIVIGTLALSCKSKKGIAYFS